MAYVAPRRWFERARSAFQLVDDGEAKIEKEPARQRAEVFTEMTSGAGHSSTEAGEQAPQRLYARLVSSSDRVTLCSTYVESFAINMTLYCTSGVSDFHCI